MLTSGGNTQIVYVKDYCEMEVLGKTRDDAIGEAFDKVARVVGLGYPGGPKIDKLSKEGNPNAIEFPKAKFQEDTLDFSFSGVKSAVLNYLNKCKMQNVEVNAADVAASFQKAVVDVLTENVLLTCKRRKVNKIAIAGGVASNSTLRENLIKVAGKRGIEVLFPDMILCTDNAAMIGSAAYYNFINGKENSLSLNAKPNLKL
jgi:N6-L-threonylcarbamoyladenine synthase